MEQGSAGKGHSSLLLINPRGRGGVVAVGKAGRSPVLGGAADAEALAAVAVGQAREDLLGRELGDLACSRGAGLVRPSGRVGVGRVGVGRVQSAAHEESGCRNQTDRQENPGWKTARGDPSTIPTSAIAGVIRARPESLHWVSRQSGGLETEGES